MSCIIENEDLSFGESESGRIYLFLKKANKYIPFDNINDCIWGDNNKFVFYVQEEPKPKKSISFLKKPTASKPFNTHVVYPKYELKLQEMKPLTLDAHEPLPIQLPEEKYNLNDIFVGSAAGIAMLLSVIQQVKQKKQQAESAKCCSESKIEIQKINYKFQELEQKINAKNEKENKALYAEMYEHYKELKEVKEDIDSTKEVLSKAINHIQEISNVKKRTED